MNTDQNAEERARIERECEANREMWRKQNELLKERGEVAAREVDDGDV